MNQLITHSITRHHQVDLNEPTISSTDTTSPSTDQTPNPVPATLTTLSIIAATMFMSAVVNTTWVTITSIVIASLTLCIWRWPYHTIRWLVRCFIYGSYRINVVMRGMPIPDRGSAVIVCNHVSFIDAMIISAISKRPIRFVSDYTLSKIPILGRVFYHLGAIPIAPFRESPEIFNRAFQAIDDALKNNEIVCIFPEGKITYDGQLAPFKRGIERILQRRISAGHPVDVYPIALRGLWGSFFSRKYGRAMSRPFARGIRSIIEIVHGQPITTSRQEYPTQTSANNLKDCLQKLLQNSKILQTNSVVSNLRHGDDESAVCG